MDEEGSYKDDQKDGLWTEYYAEPGQNGAKKKVSNYSNGQKQGAETSYHKDGSTVQSEGSYKDDLKREFGKPITTTVPFKPKAVINRSWNREPRRKRIRRRKKRFVPVTGKNITKTEISLPKAKENTLAKEFGSSIGTTEIRLIRAR